MTPARYLRRRREAAGLTIEQAARKFVHRPDQQAECEANLRSFESDGIIVKPWVLDALTRAFRFDPQIYRMLAEEPAERHPMLCATCGWDEWTDELDLAGDSVRWTVPERCSRCDQLDERARRSAAATGQLV